MFVHIVARTITGEHKVYKQNNYFFQSDFDPNAPEQVLAPHDNFKSVGDNVCLTGYTPPSWFIWAKAII